MVGGQRGHGVRRVDRDHHVAQHEAAAGAQGRRRCGRRGPPCRAPRGGGWPGPRRRGRRGRPAAGRSARPPAARRGEPAEAGRAASSMASFLSTPTAAAPRWRAEHGGQGLAGPGPEVEHRRDGQPRRSPRPPPPAGARRPGPPRAHQVEIRGRVEVGTGSQGEQQAALVGGAQVQRSTKTESPSVRRLMTSSITPLAPLPQTPCCRS